MASGTLETAGADLRDKPDLSLEERSAFQPAPSPAPTRAVSPARQNNIGFIRLLAASMVIVSHSAELMDGNRNRELLTRLFGTLSFGDLGVDIFFLISGYLITKSYLTSERLTYLAKRVNRIYPGYLVAYALSVLVVAPLAGIGLSSLGALDYFKAAGHALWLDMPRWEGGFAGQHYHYLNGAMWTISYEFRCYLFVMLIGALGVYKKRFVPVCVVMVFLALHFLVVNDVNPSGAGWLVAKEVLLGNVTDLTRFLAVFLTGCFEVHRGYYYALKPDPGWRKSWDAGNNFFWYPTKHAPGWFILIGGDQAGSVRVSIGSHAYHPEKIWKVIKFPDHTPIRILLHDKQTELSAPSDHFLSAGAQNLYLDGSKDCTVILPSFEVGENKIPSLSAHLRWSDGRYIELIPLQ